eukprot:TRINITY_DN11981_c0_g1_i1.p1 TRINITY_DN11981_c0_g1~~TRINITY_DN11981_c0_g1_i1.p1  ORF type:complete len:712 (+),score=189.87 TRINITY_DN11981_c0_g1_i1:125-2260(+)
MAAESQELRGSDRCSDVNVMDVPCDQKKSFEGKVDKDPMAAYVSVSARVFVFAALCQGVQMFMSYDGGAVPASLESLQERSSHDWSEFEIGLLGSMDKIGMVFASVPWGWLLKRCPAKWLMVVSLALNAMCTFVYGFLFEPELMYATRFMMGVTQALQGVWSTVWTVNMAPPVMKTRWIGLGAVSAGVGNGIGFGVAGFGTANGLPYSFAFQLAGGVLAVFWITLIFLPADWLKMKGIESREAAAANESEAEAPLRANAVGSDAPPKRSVAETMEELTAMLKNKVYLWTALAISLTMFQTSAIQFLWNRVFSAVWPELSLNWVTLMCLVVSGAGGGVGIALGPRFIDKRGGFGTPPGVVRSLQALYWFQILAAVGGVLGCMSVYGKLHSQQPAGEWGDGWLWFCWASIFLILAAQNACVAALCGINVEVIPEPSRTFASGAEMTVRNILGYMCGPLLPAVVMSLNRGWESKVWELSCGLTFVFLVNLTGPALLGHAKHSARSFLDAQKKVALEQLRDGLREQSAESLQQAVRFALRVDLDKEDYGIATIGMANQAIGQLLAGEGLSSIAATSSFQGLYGRAVGLEREVASQREELRQHRDEILRLRGQLGELGGGAAAAALASATEEDALAWAPSPRSEHTLPETPMPTLMPRLRAPTQNEETDKVEKAASSNVEDASTACEGCGDTLLEDDIEREGEAAISTADVEILAV